MMLRPFSLICRRLRLAALCGLVLAGAVYGQGLPSPQILPADGAEAFQKQFGRREAKQFDELTKSTEPWKPENTKFVELAAQHYAYRLTWPEYHQPASVAAGMHRLVVQEAFPTIEQAYKNRTAVPQLWPLFSKNLVLRLAEVLPNDRAIARVNAARMLSQLAEKGVEEAADPLAEAALNARDDGTRYYALQGLKHLFALTRDRQSGLFKDKAREQKSILAALSVVERKVSAKGASREEIEGLCVVRREAVRALGHVPAPAVGSGAKLDGRVAQGLLRVACKDDLEPAPRLDERVEAAVAVGKLQSKLYPGYQPDYAAYLLGHFLLDFGRAYQIKDAKGEDGKTKVTTERAQPWKVHASRLAEALDAMKADTKDTYVAKLVDQSARLLAQIETGSPASLVGDLENWLANNAPANKTVYKGVADSAVKLPPKEDEEKPAEKKP